MIQTIRKLLFIVVGTFDVLLKRYPEVTVLCYHSIADISWPFNTTPNNFKKQVVRLEKTHLFITPKQFEGYMFENKKFNKPAILLTFDDGYKSILNIKDFLLKKQIKPILFFESDPNNINRSEIENDFPLLTVEDIKSLLSDGWVLGSHGSTHANLLKLDDAQLQNEIVNSKQLLQKTFTTPIRYFAYSRGFYNDSSLKKVSDVSYILAFTMDHKILSIDTDSLTIPRIGVMQSHGLVEFNAMQSKTAIHLKQLLQPTISA